MVSRFGVVRACRVGSYEKEVILRVELCGGKLSHGELWLMELMRSIRSGRLDL